nr:MAG TPA: hypothetical protein [Caudoviricetes sp.]
MIPIDKFKILNQIINQLLEENEPTDEELNYDENLIAIYENLHNLRASLSYLNFSA